MTWLDIGNGWRNLFLLSCMLQAVSLGVLFATRREWMKEHRAAAFFAGVAVTPFAQYLWMLLLALLWPAAPKLLYIGVPPALAAGYLVWLVVKHRKRWTAILRGGWQRIKQIRVDRAAVVSICFAAAMGVLLMPVCIRLATSTVAAQADSGEYMGLALRYVEDRDTAALFEKDDIQADYRGHSHFPSLELYMGYGLMHASDVYGYPYDKPMFTAVGILVFYLLAAFIALCLHVARGRVRWLMLALLLFNLIPNLLFSVATAPRDTWRCLAVLLAALMFFDLRPGKGRRYALSLLAAFLICFTAMSAHVVCFVIVPFIVLAWAAVVIAEAAARREKPLRVLLQSAGMAIAGAAGVLLAFAGNLWCYAKWGEFSPWRVLTIYTDAPWYATYLRMEYRLEETTTSLNFWKAKYDIVMAYATPVGIWGLRLALAALVLGIVWMIWKRGRKPTDLTRPKPDLSLITVALLTLFTLAPMTGLLDTSLYSFSGTFLKLQRYTLQWYLFACVMIAAAGAYVEDKWPAFQAWVQKRLHRTSCPLWTAKIPAFVCALLCIVWFIGGTKVTGYSASFYRYGSPILTNTLYAQDNFITHQYGTLLKFAALLEDEQNIIIARESYQYPLHSRALMLTTNPVAPILNLPLADIPTALAERNVAAVATEPSFWDERFYAETTLSAYLSALPPDQIVQEDNMRIYILDADLAAAFHAAYE